MLKKKKIAMFPRTAWQYQNGEVRLGMFFTTSEAFLGATSIVSQIVASHFINLLPTTSCAGASYAVCNQYIQ
jgi:hypothetical protein